MSPAWGQNQPDADQLSKSLDDALVQLKAAQDRKNELATETQKLQKRIADQEAELVALRDQLDSLENRAYFLREHYAAWQKFVETNPSIRVMWLNVFNATNLTQNPIVDLIGPEDWPFSVDEPQPSIYEG